MGRGTRRKIRKIPVSRLTKMSKAARRDPSRAHRCFRSETAGCDSSGNVTGNKRRLTDFSGLHLECETVARRTKRRERTRAYEQESLKSDSRPNRGVIKCRIPIAECRFHLAAAANCLASMNIFISLHRYSKATFPGCT